MKNIVIYSTRVATSAHLMFWFFAAYTTFIIASDRSFFSLRLRLL